MEENFNFETLRVELYSEVISWIKPEEEINEQFKRKFLKLIELCTLSMMSGEDNFFAYFMMNISKHIKLDLPSAAGTIPNITGFEMFFNPKIFLSCSILQMESIIKHEIYHIINQHYKRERALRKKYSKLAINLAMDVSINQYIKNLPPWSNTLESVGMSYNVELKMGKTLEEYVDDIERAIYSHKDEKAKAVIDDILDDNLQRNEELHNIWDKAWNNMNMEDIDGLTKRTALQSVKGNIPEQIEKYIKDMNRNSQIRWQDYLKKISGTLPEGHRKTITRRNRRQPDRLDLHGTLSKKITEIIIALDISGSISDNEFYQSIGEVFSIIKNQNREVTIIECDSAIRRIYKVKNTMQVKKKINTRGATAYSPVFEYMNMHGHRNSILVYFTDGLGEKELTVAPLNYHIIWVLTGKGKELSLNHPYGKILRLSNVEYEEPDIFYAKNELKEIRMEWAR
ncbi:MAG: peptidase [Clostridiaceae bacterium]|jgi:predicted metal-dependent peptidase|nr:peptidase [Clostridiaceae bacterium]